VNLAVLLKDSELLLWNPRTGFDSEPFQSTDFHYEYRQHQWSSIENWFGCWTEVKLVNFSLRRLHCRSHL